MTQQLDQRFVTLAEAGILLGGDKPYSTKTIQRLVSVGRLVAVGDRALRRITRKSLDSLIAELEAGAPLWPARSAERTAVAPSGRTRRASGSPATPSATDSTGPFVSLTNRRAKRG